MFAVVKSGGKQYKTALGDVLTLEKLAGNVGDQVELEVIFIGDNATADSKSGGKVSAEIIGQVKGDKVMTLKKRRRHNSRRRRGHRQQLTMVQVITLGAEKLAADKKKKPVRIKSAPAPKAKTIKAAEAKAKQTAEARATQAVAKAAAPKKPAAAKKPAAKKTTKKEAE
jgi:large subunit ribosomal protein L21